MPVRPRQRWRRTATAAVCALSVAAMAGCTGIPRDPEGTLERVVATAELRAGASPADGRVHIAGDGDPAGALVEVVEEYAGSLGADVVWTIGSEEELVEALERRQIDLAIGGMTDRGPWSDRVAVTRGYPALAQDGRDPAVILCPLGENALLASVERFLDRTVSAASTGSR